MKAVVTPVIGRVETAAETFLVETDVRENPSQRATVFTLSSRLPRPAAQWRRSWNPCHGGVCEAACHGQRHLQF